ncbi:MAG TPA: hypothetical protein VGW39_06160 [Chthoniobacterales bacterium]|nr:hypothetical protein [Chthoniobacterales bacterium]
MKFLLAMISAGLCLAAGLVGGQEPPLPAKSETPLPTPSATPVTRPQLDIPEIPIPVEPRPLVPNPSVTTHSRAPTSADTAKAATALSQLDAAFQKSPLGQAAEEQRLHIEWRQLQNRTAHDPDVLAAKEAAAKAKTDFARREQLRAYYNIQYARMRALASSPALRSYLDAKKAAALGGLAQPRVRPETGPQSRPDS